MIESAIQVVDGLDVTMAQLADGLTSGFEDYIVPAKFTPAIAAMVVKYDTVDLEKSLIAYDGEEIVGVLMLARRGNVSRIAALGIAKRMRSQGLGRQMMERAIEAARDREDPLVILECIEQNPRAVAFYERLGFVKKYRLLSFKATLAESRSRVLENITQEQLAESLLKGGPVACAWQSSAASVLQASTPNRAVRYGPVSAMITISEPKVICRAMALESAPPEDIKAFLDALAGDYPGREFMMPAFYPEPYFGDLMKRAGLEEGDITQFEMELKL